MFVVKCKHHCLLVDSHEFAICHRDSRSHASRLSSKATFSEEISLVQYAQSCFFAARGYHCEPDPAFLNIEDRVSGIPLCEDCLFLGEGRDSPTRADNRKEFPWVEVAFFLGRHARCPQHSWCRNDMLRKFTRMVITKRIEFCRHDSLTPLMLSVGR